MASFSFGAGNARKLAAVPLYVLGRIATFVIPRSRDAWVFGCGAGIGDGALALWRAADAAGTASTWLVGSAREAAEADAAGIPHVRKGTWRGFWRTARARVVVVTHGFGDVNRYAVSGAFIVQLWHGIPLKRIGLDSPETLRVPRVLERAPLVAGLARRALRMMFAGAARRIRILPAASHLVRGRLESAFGLSDAHIVVSGEPRVDVLSQGTPAQRRSRARDDIHRLTGADVTSRFVLYAPTWRDGGPDPAVPTAAEWREIIDVLDDADATLLVRSHPLGAGAYVPPLPTARVRALGSDVASDITPLLPGMDVLITDYSSLAFDAGLVGLPVVYLAPDVAEYARTRGFYGRFEDVAGPAIPTTWLAATERLRTVLTDDAALAEERGRSEGLSRHVHAFRDGNNTERVLRAILAGIAEDDRRRGHR